MDEVIFIVASARWLDVFFSNSAQTSSIIITVGDQNRPCLYSH